MIQEIYIWLEEHSGVSYDFSEDFDEMYDELIFIDTFDWYNRFENIKDKLIEALEIVDEYQNDIPDDLPSPIEIKQLIKESVVSQLLNMVNVVNRQLNFSPTELSSFSKLETEALTLAKLISFVKENSLEEIAKNKLFDKYEEENDMIFEDVLELVATDISSISFAVTDIRTSYFKSLEDDETEDE